MNEASNLEAKLRDEAQRIDELVRNPDIVWYAGRIGKFLGMSGDDALRLMQKGAIPGARKIGGRWCASKRELARFFVVGAEAADV